MFSYFMYLIKVIQVCTTRMILLFIPYKICRKSPREPRVIVGKIQGTRVQRVKMITEQRDKNNLRK